MQSESELPPALQHADTDGGPPVKRRRPALSCAECRKRKVKCDRGKPCGPCSKTKSPTCTYRSYREERRTGPSSCASRVDGDGGVRSSAPMSSTSNNDVVAELKDRLRYLEEQLAVVHMGETRSFTGASQPLRDTSNWQPSTYFVKSKFFGESHWLNCIEPYESLGSSNIIVDPSTNRTEVDAFSDLYSTVAECKHMARSIKATRMLHPVISAEVQDSVPSKAVCDQLIQCYLRTFEGVFRVLHIPSFLRDCESYWVNPTVAKPSVLTKMLLVCAIGVPFFASPDQPRLRASCTKWIQAAESWLSAPHEKSRLNMAGLQIHILLLLARQVCSVDGDLTWISAGSLLRSAMHLGLHRDPHYFQKISRFNMEMRRRLWATVMEMTVQTSLDMGMPPLISPDEYDTQPPSNINDSELECLDDLDATPFSARPDHEFTQSSMQIAFYDSLPLRLEITRLLNSIRSPPSYEETLRLGKSLLTHCHRHTKFFQNAMNVETETRPNAFQVKLFDTLMRRFALCLHRPFFNKAKDHPEYYYSRKVCLDLSTIITTPATLQTPSPSSADDDDWTLLSYHSVGFLKSFFLHSISTIYLELISQLSDEENISLHALSVQPPDSVPGSLPPQLNAYRTVLIDARDKAMQRLRHGETNAKGYTWLAAAVARIDALTARTNPDAAVLGAAKAAIAEVRETMRAAYFAENGAQIELAQRAGPFAGRDHGRGEGADDVTGVPRAERAAEQQQQPHAWDESADGGFMEGMEWEELLRDGAAEVGWGFENSPESWFGWGGGLGSGMGL